MCFPFCNKTKILDHHCNKNCLILASKPNSLSLLKIEMAIVADVGEHFVKYTYKLEGDGLAIVCYKEVLKLQSVIQVGHYPDTSAIARELAGGNTHIVQQWVSYALSCVHKAFSYLETKFGDDSH